MSRKPSSGSRSGGGLIANDQSKKWKVELNFKKDWEHMQSLYSKEDNGKKTVDYFYSLNRGNSPFGAISEHYQERHQYIEDTYWETRKKIFKNFDEGKITENKRDKQLVNIYKWRNNSEKKNEQIRDKEDAIYEKLREAYHEKYKGYL